MSLIEGGLGNRMMALCSGMIAAEFSQRELLAYWPIIRSQNQHEQFHLACTDLWQCPDSIRWIDHTEQKRFRKKKSVKYYPKRPIRAWKLRLDHDHAFLAMQVHGILRHECISAAGIREKYQQFSLRPQLQWPTDMFASQLFKPGQTVAVQVRMHGHKNARKWNPYVRAIKLLDRLVAEDPSRVYFLSCDDVDTTLRIMARYQDKTTIRSVPKPEVLNTENALKATAVDIELCRRADVFYGTAHSALTLFIWMIRGDNPPLVTGPADQQIWTGQATDRCWWLKEPLKGL